VQTDWPGATKDITCFRETPLNKVLHQKMLPEFLHIVCGEAYSALSVKHNNQIITPYSSHQLNTVKCYDDLCSTLVIIQKASCPDLLPQTA